MFLTVPLFTTLSLAYGLLRRLPLRRATFSTVANAVRGPWWDGILWGDCSLWSQKLRYIHSETKVMFGVDVQDTHQISLAPSVDIVQKYHEYCGMDAQRPNA